MFDFVIPALWIIVTSFIFSVAYSLGKLEYYILLLAFCGMIVYVVGFLLAVLWGLKYRKEIAEKRSTADILLHGPRLPTNRIFSERAENLRQHLSSSFGIYSTFAIICVD